VIRQGHLIAVVRAFLIGCAVLLVVGCAGVRSKATKQEQGRSPEATASEEARCEGTRTYHSWYIEYPNGQNSFPNQSGSAEDMKKARKKAEKVGDKLVEAGVYTTNDLPGCPKGGLLLGTDKTDFLDGLDGDDEIRGLGGKDVIKGGAGNDVIYGGAGNDELRAGHEQGQGEDVLYGGDGNDFLVEDDWQRGKLYCGKGKDIYAAHKKEDYVDSSCEKPAPGQGA
jgi:Ca2+-binding RTX toxin-like protein